jgi:hypothetical protein
VHGAVEPQPKKNNKDSSRRRRKVSFVLRNTLTSAVKRKNSKTVIIAKPASMKSNSCNCSLLKKGIFLTTFARLRSKIFLCVDWASLGK